MTAAARRRHATLGALLLIAAPAGAAEPLQPFQMVRSLQLVQDRIAAGDHAALPMQKKLLEIIDRRFRDSAADEFKDKRNFRAVLVYGMSGGNPATLKKVLSGLTLESADKKIGDGILGYVTGQPKKAEVALAGADPLSFAPELGSFVALVKGSIAAVEKPAAALPLLDQARLLAPGTLVEEAALRRTISLSTTLNDSARFLLACDQYVRRYLRSPYASQFADSFVSGVIALRDLKLENVEAIAAQLSPEQEKVIYLRIARRAIIEGLDELSAFASAKAQGVEPAPAEEEDPRALLYSSLATVTSGDVPDILEKLGRIDRSKLTASDRELLDAVRTVATEVISPVQPDKDADAAPAAISGEAALPEAGAPDPRQDESEPALPALEADGEPAPPPAAEQAQAPGSSSQQPGTPPTAPETSPEEKFVADARGKLDAIDKLLSEKSE